MCYYNNSNIKVLFKYISTLLIHYILLFLLAINSKLKLQHRRIGTEIKIINIIYLLSILFEKK